ncbi:RNA polymerase subunit sigma [Bacillus cereus]|uniref:sigma-70 family RNA polymerase sigma factor n=1 Tax=Bacillus cereus TaxID=1396 RepID=UPI000BFCADEB|nr:sigma-70 family RNA polymerase sigma factor [Bacillus cereus]PGK10573.1 RNA polymerase subunit sigma [Bacillus cereus]PGU60320.1 RNA polymerase subunit sigma [Bacillus cereus]
MTPEELFEEKEHLVLASIKQIFGSYHVASQVAKKNNMELDDLIQIGKVRLWELCLKYNSKLSEAFNTYAIKTLKWKIINELHEKGKVIKVSRSCSPEERNSMKFISVDLYVDGESENGFYAVDPLKLEEEVIISMQCQEVLNQLNSEEKLILIKKSHGFTDEEIGKELGKTRLAINKRKTRAYKKINPDYKRVIKGEIRKKKNHLLAQVI